MEVITMESEVYKKLSEKIANIERFVIEAGRNKEELDKMWVDSYTVCKYLSISERTLQRLRSKRMIAYSTFSGKIYYTLGEIKRALAQRTIRRSEDQLNNMVDCYKNNLRKALKK